MYPLLPHNCASFFVCLFVLSFRKSWGISHNCYLIFAGIASGLRSGGGDDKFVSLASDREDEEDASDSGDD